jgi:hypothetical protein
MDDAYGTAWAMNKKKRLGLMIWDSDTEPAARYTDGAEVGRAACQ